MTGTRRAFLGATVLTGLAACSGNNATHATGTGVEPDRSARTATGSAGKRPPRQVPIGPAGTRLTADTSVPLTPLRHLMTVPARVNGRHHGTFAIDSGSAAELHISSRLGRDLPRTGTIEQSDPGGGPARSVPLVGVDSLTIGSATLSGIDATVGADLGDLRVDGIIGVGLFGQLTATVDYPHRRLHLSRTGLPVGAHTVGLSRGPGGPRVTVRAADRTVVTDIDTGNPGALTVPRSAGLTFSTGLRRAGIGRVSTGTFPIWSARLDGDLAVAGWTDHAPTVDVVDALPTATLGAGFLRAYAITFDLRSGRLALQR